MSNAMDEVNKHNEQVFGSGQNSGMFGLGQYHADPYRANASAFSPNASENEYIQNLQNMAYGRTQSPAELQMQQGLQQSLAQSQALAASQRGISPALAARMGAMANAGMSQNVNQNAAILRAQQQQAMMGQLGNEMQSVRGGQMGLENLRSGNENYAMGVNSHAYGASAGQRSSMMNNVMSGFGALGGMSGGGGGGGGGGGMMAGGPMDAGGASSAMMVAAGGGEVPSPESFNHTPPVPDIPGAPQKSGKGGLSSFAGLAMLAMSSGGEVAPPQSHSGKYLCMFEGGLTPGAMQPMGNYMPTGMTAAQPQAAAPMAAPMGQKAAPRFLGAQQRIGKYGAGLVPPPQPPQIAQPPEEMPMMDQNYGMYANRGAVVPGKAAVPGNSLKNDKIPAMLSPKEIVLPRSVTMAPNAPDKAKAFVAAIQARNKRKGLG